VFGREAVLAYDGYPESPEAWEWANVPVLLDPQSPKINGSKALEWVKYYVGVERNPGVNASRSLEARDLV
jgi:hypothetical protein